MLPISPSNPSTAEIYSLLHLEDALAEVAAERVVRGEGPARRQGRVASEIGSPRAFAATWDRVCSLVRRRQPTLAPARRD